jgi:hypothetical protein
VRERESERGAVVAALNYSVTSNINLTHLCNTFLPQVHLSLIPSTKLNRANLIHVLYK